MILGIHKIGQKILDFLMYNSHSFKEEWPRKKCFLFSSKMAENKRKSQNFFSKCDAASGARFELDVEEL